MNDLYQVLIKNMSGLDKAHGWLMASYQKCVKINLASELSLDELDALEALSSRFARVMDFLLQRVFRTIEEIELSSGGTLLDVIHRFQKRGFDLDEDRFREMRELRNRISHEYVETLLSEMFKELLEFTPYLDHIIFQTQEYANKLLSRTPTP